MSFWMWVLGVIAGSVVIYAALSINGKTETAGQDDHGHSDHGHH